MPAMGHVEWLVPWAAGELLATGYKAGQPYCNASVKTAQAAHSISLEVVSGKDISGADLRADGQDAAIVAATVVDAEGVAVPDASHYISFTTATGGAVVGIANGDPASLERTRAAQGSAFHGKIAAIVQRAVAASAVAAEQPLGPLTVTASSPGLAAGTVALALASD